MPGGHQEPPVRSHAYQESFHANDSAELARLLKTIHHKDSDARKAGRQPGKVDECFRKRAEELLHGELAVALGIPIDEVQPYISRSISEAAAETPKA